MCARVASAEYEYLTANEGVIRCEYLEYQGQSSMGYSKLEWQPRLDEARKKTKIAFSVLEKAHTRIY